MPDRAFVSGPKVPKTAVGRQRKRSSGASRQEQRGAINRAENNSRYFTCFKTISRGTGRITEFATHSSCANGTFESFKNRFSRYHSASEVSRPFGSFCSKLASYFKRPRRSGGRCGLQTRVHNNSIPNMPAPRTTLLKIGLDQNRFRDPIPATERGPKTSSTRSRPVSEQSFSSSQTRRDSTSSDQPQGFEWFSPIHTFQNGGYPSPARSSSTGGLAGQSRPEGCLFCSTDLEGSPEVSSFPLEGHTSGICLSPVWSSSRTEIVHQNYEAVVALLRRAGIRLIIYLDDLLFMHATQEGLREGMATARYLLENLGFVINLEKSVFVPTQKLEFLGFVINTIDMILVLPDDKVKSIKSLCRTLLGQQLVSVRDLSQLIGKLTASIQAVFPAPLHYRHLQHLKNQGLAKGSGYDSCLPLSREAREEIQWWLVHLEAWNGRAILSSPPDLVIETDASKVGWGAVCQGVRTGGLWSQMEKKLHINCLELLAGSFAVKSFTKNRLCAHVRLRMDNTTAVAYVNRLGGTHSLVLSNLALALWEWAQKNSIMLRAEHYAGHLNTVADWESRHFRDASNWRLDQNVFSSLMQIRGPCVIDLFADRLNSQLPQFYSWKPDPLAIATDALLQDWSRGRNYAFPPFCLIMRSLAKLQGAGGELILITPVWPTQAWYPRLLDMSVAPPVLLPSFPDLLLSPRGERHPLLLNETLSLAAWHVSISPCSRRAFLQTLPGSSWLHGGQAQAQFITPPGKNGIAGVTAGKLIHFAPLWLI